MNNNIWFMTPESLMEWDGKSIKRIAPDPKLDLEWLYKNIPLAKFMHEQRYFRRAG